MGARGSIIAKSYQRHANRCGTTATFKQLRTLKYDTSTGQAPIDTPSFTAKGFFEEESEIGKAEIGGTTVTVIRGKSKLFILPAQDLTEIPQVGDLIDIAGESYSISESKPHTIDDVVVAHALKLQDV